MVQEITSARVDNENGANVALVVGSYMENISAHGIPNIKRTQSPIRRLLWVCAFLASFSMCVWQVKSLIYAFLDRQVTTNVDIKSVTVLSFPAVTICNLNNMRRSYMEKQDELVEEFQNAEGTQSNQFQLWEDANLDIREDFLYLIDKVTEFVAAIPYDDRVITGHNISDALLSCSFNGYPCLPSNLTYTYNYLYGNCYTFNDGTHPPIQNTTNAGPLYDGWTFYLRKTLPESPLVRLPGPATVGVAFLGYYRRIEYRRLAAPFHSKCLERDVQTIFSNEFSGISYSKRACMKDCMYRETFENCGCYDPKYVFSPETTPICTVEDENQVRCMEAVENQIIIGNITCRCGPACSEILYKTSISSTMWPGNDYMSSVVEKFKHTPDLQRSAVEEDDDEETKYYIKTNFAKVNIYYENLQYDYIEQVPTYTFLSLVSNVGGHLGLWIGMSALTILEFLECFYDIVKHVCAALIRRRKVNQMKKRNTVNVRPSRNAFQNDAFSQK
ncbi:acid-sensing ion channel 1C-like [Anneissia japonica]|uniref:acid-sensing ion channel 1C-like n=1 Tax=Anneissia japonica TaxID=1529436 RepID=UPI001425940F|nr:acid-sensing ion channel 1C-like [Anneissia japonica]